MSSSLSVLRRVVAMLALPCALLLAAVPAQAVETSAWKDQTCAGYRFGGTLGCNAKEFTVSPSFSAAAGTPPVCTPGAEFNFKVDLALSGTNTDRYDIGFFVGQQGNDPGATTAGNICSVATFPKTPAPWEDDDSNACGDYNGGGVSTTTINEIKVVCQGDSTGALQIPYLLTYKQSTGGTCTGPGDVIGTSTSKCNKATALVNGVVAVNAAAYLDVTKQTLPDGHAQSFSYTATGPAGSKLVVYAGGVYTPSDNASATNTATFTLTDGQTARVYINATTAAQTLTVVETAVAGWDATAAISCSAVSGSPTFTTSNATRTFTADLSAANYAAACTITNTKLPTLQLTKISNGDVGTWTFSGTNGWSNQNITTATSGVGVNGTRQTLTAASTSTQITEAAVAGYRLAGISCSGLGSGGTATNDIPNRRVTLDTAATAPGSDISCTYTNQRQRPLTVTKSLSPGADPGKFVMTANGTAGSEGGNGATANATVDVGATATFSEAAGTGTSLVNYASGWSCNTTPTATTGSGSSGSLTMPNADITCTMTNTRKSAQLTLRKTWGTGITGDTATVSSTGFTNNATSGASVSTGNNSTTGSATTVYSGESGTISESVSVGNAANYNSALACAGSSGLSGSTLTVAPADTAITCTYTNTRKSAQLTVRKTWSSGNIGDTATVSSTGFGNNATSGASVSTGNNTTAGSAVTVYAAESGTISESFTLGDPANYVAVLACTGSGGLSGTTLTVAPADTVITCTYTNTKKQPLLSITKLQSVVSDPVHGTSAPKSIPGSVQSYTIRVTNSGPGPVDNNSLVLADPLPARVELFVNDLGGAGQGPVLFADGTPGSGLTWTFTSLSSLTDSIDFSNNNGLTWTYVPVPDANGFDGAVTHIRLRPAGAMNAAGVGNPWADFTFRARVK